MNSSVTLLKKFVTKMGYTVVIFVLVGVLFSMLRPDSVKADDIVVIPNHATYKQLGHGRKQAPFGGGAGCNMLKSVKSNWPVNTTLKLTHVFTVPAGATNFRIQLSIDNDAKIYLNNSLIGSVVHGDCPKLDEELVTDTVGALKPGSENTLKIEAVDRGVVSFFDLRALVDAH